MVIIPDSAAVLCAWSRVLHLPHSTKKELNPCQNFSPLLELCSEAWSREFSDTFERGNDRERGRERLGRRKTGKEIVTDRKEIVLKQY